MGEQCFCLRWNNYQSNVVGDLRSLLEQEEFVDVTLACEGRRLKAHRLMLSACSNYFRNLLKVNYLLIYYNFRIFKYIFKTYCYYFS